VIWSTNEYRQRTIGLPAISHKSFIGVPSERKLLVRRWRLLVMRSVCQHSCVPVMRLRVPCLSLPATQRRVQTRRSFICAKGFNPP
jgi:hypothetical protein